MNQNRHKEFLKTSEIFPEKSGRALQIDEILIETAMADSGKFIFRSEW